MRLIARLCILGCKGIARHEQKERNLHASSARSAQIPAGQALFAPRAADVRCQSCHNGAGTVCQGSSSPGKLGAASANPSTGCASIVREGGDPQLHPQRNGKAPAADNNPRSPSRDLHEGLQGQQFGNMGCLVAFGLRLVALCMRFRRLNSGRRAQPCSECRRRGWRRASVPQRAMSIQFRSPHPALNLGPESRSPGGDAAECSDCARSMCGIA